MAFTTAQEQALKAYATELEARSGQEVGIARMLAADLARQATALADPLALPPLERTDTARQFLKLQETPVFAAKLGYTDFMQKHPDVAEEMRSQAGIAQGKGGITLG